MRINVLGLMNTHIFAAKQMVKQGFGGRIIGAGSIASYRTAENLGPYGATKFAVRGFTEACAKEWAQYDIRVNGESRLSHPPCELACKELGADWCGAQRMPRALSTRRCGITLTASSRVLWVSRLLPTLAIHVAEIITGGHFHRRS